MARFRDQLMFGVQALACSRAGCSLKAELQTFDFEIALGIEDGLNQLTFPTPEWRDPWVPVSKDDAPMLEAELSRELPDGHVLYARQARAIARRLDNDDVLFVLDGGPGVAVVHLTYASRPEQTPEWPGTRLFANLEEWVQLCMLRDHAEHIADA